MAGRNIAVFGIYSSEESVKRAVDTLIAAGIPSSDISVLLPDSRSTHDLAHEKATKAPEGAASGGTAGGVIGGTLGVLAGIGALAIPGIGPLVAAGPIVAGLAGLGVGGAVGGLVGALVGMGIPEYEAKRYEGRVQKGGSLLSVHCEASGEVSRAKDLLKGTGAEDVASTGESHSPTPGTRARPQETTPGRSGHTSAIRVSKVLGTKVQNPGGKNIGKVEDVILDKQNNHIMFAVLSFGGLMGVGQKYYPVPWSALDYDENQNSYVVDYTQAHLEGAPAGSVEELTQNDGLNFRDRTYWYYKAEPYWDQ